jgi:hypothetical protein
MAFTARQDLMIRAYLAIAAKVGLWAKDAGSEGAGYVESSLNTGAPAGFKCENCAFFRGPKACTIVKGIVDRSGVCRLYVIQQDKLKKIPLAATPRSRIDGSTG